MLRSAVGRRPNRRELNLASVAVGLGRFRHSKLPDQIFLLGKIADNRVPKSGNAVETKSGVYSSACGLLRRLREFLDTRGFLEVQPPCLASDCVVDAYLDPIVVDAQQLGIGLPAKTEMFLQTSPEAAMKRMLAAGAPSIYSIGPVFRAGEHGARHNVEFTMLEWYELGGDLASGIQLLGELALEILGGSRFDIVSYRSVFQQCLSIDPIDAPMGRLLEACSDEDPQLIQSVSTDRDALLDVLLSNRIQPTLGVDSPVIVKDYPLSQAALARQSDSDPQCAGRFELFASGVELANGYDELTDPDVFDSRAQQHNLKRELSGRKKLPVQSKLLHSMRGQQLPRSAGVALGVDRLLMVQVGAESIDQVIPITMDRA